MKLLSALLWSSLLATMAPSAWAQANTIPSQPHLLVKGQGTRTVMPDRFGLQLNIEETDMDADAARRRVQDNVARALALYQTATFGGMAAGSWLWGMVADLQGLDAALVCAAGLLILGAVIGQHHAAEGGGADAADFDDGQAVESSAHVRH